MNNPESSPSKNSPITEAGIKNQTIELYTQDDRYKQELAQTALVASSNDADIAGTLLTTSTEVEATPSSDALDKTLESLGLYNNEQLEGSVAILLSLLQPNNPDEETHRQAWTQYTTTLQDTIEKAAEPESYTKLQIAAIIHKAMIFQKAKDTFRYVEELQDAQIYAVNQNLEDTSKTLEEQIDIALSAYEKEEPSAEYIVLIFRSRIDSDNYEMLRDELLDGATQTDILGAAYGMLLEQGEDPDEVLREVGVVE